MTVLAGDVLDVLPTLPADSFDAMLTDPPYGIGFMGKAWDTPGAFVERQPERSNTWDKVGGNHNPTGPLDRARTRLSEGVKFQAWCEAWAAEALRVLKPGAFALVFGGTRTFHRLAVALEDAGFEMRDTLMWVYGSGFPKSHDVSKAIDKAAGAEREVLAASAPVKRMIPGADQDRTGSWLKDNGRTFTPTVTAPATADAARWQGYGTALKPAWEPVLLVRKPTPLTFAENALRHGTGALAIDAARVPTGEAIAAHHGTKGGAVAFTASGSRGYQPGDNGVYLNRSGRWPANVLHDGSRAVLDLFPATTARFFYTAKASTSERNAGLPGRNPHPTVKPLALTEYLAKLLLPPARDGDPRRILVPFAGSGSEVIGAIKAGWDEAVGIEREDEYATIAHARIQHHTTQAPLPM